MILKASQSELYNLNFKNFIMTYKRRNFLKKSALLGGLPLLIHFVKRKKNYLIVQILWERVMVFLLPLKC